MEFWYGWHGVHEGFDRLCETQGEGDRGQMKKRYERPSTDVLTIKLTPNNFTLPMRVYAQQETALNAAQGLSYNPVLSSSSPTNFLNSASSA